MSELAFAQSAAKIQDSSMLRSAAEDFLREHTATHAGEVKISIGKVDSRLNLPACANLAAFLPQGSKPWGKTTIGIRCTAPNSWTVYLSANVQVTGEYFVAATALAQGQIIAASDMHKMSGDLASLPAGVVTDATQAIGKSVTASFISGSPLRVDTLKAATVIQQGQAVRIIGTGPGFQVATDALAMNNASEGQVAKAKTVSGQLVSGIARVGGVIEISF